MSIHSEIKRLRQAKGWSHQRVAEEVSKLENSPKRLAWQTVQQWEKEIELGGTAPKRNRLEFVALALGTSVEALLAADRQVLTTPPMGVAHSVSLPTLETVPTFTWEQVGMTRKEDLPPVFRAQIVDGAMAPRVPSGSWVQFDSRVSPKPGDGVMLRDRSGAVSFRYYRAGRPGLWEAHAENPAYAPLESERDGLEVLAVLTGVEGRWS